MATVLEIERGLLGLPPAERERLAMKAWESLVNDPDAASDSAIDPGGMDLAEQRDAALVRGDAKAIGDEEFHRRTGGGE